MALTITLPDRLKHQLEQAAATHRLSLEEFTINLLDAALISAYTGPSPEEVVASIKALPPNPHTVRPAHGSLAEALRGAPEHADVDLAAWQQAWQTVEAEMKALTHANDVAEGR